MSTGKGRNQASTGKVEIRESTENMGSGRVPKMGNPGEYRKWGIWASTDKGRIQESTENVGSGRVPGR